MDQDQRLNEEIVAEESAEENLAQEVFEEVVKIQEAFADAENAEDAGDTEDTGDTESDETADVEPAVSIDPVSADPITVSLDLAEIQSSMEALLFISDKPLSLDKLHDLIGPTFERTLFEEAIRTLCERYQNTHHGIELVEIAGGYQFRTKVGRGILAQKLAKTQTQRLSTGSMEALAIIAYKQPVMKEEIDKIRGVDSSYFIRGLLEKKLIQISGRSELPGRPLLYSTTHEFLEIFGLKDLSAMPSLQEIEQMVPTSEARGSEEDNPQTREMRRLVSAMNHDRTSELYYNPREDEKILKEIRERVSAISTSTPYLDELKNAELLEKEEVGNDHVV